MLRRLCLGILPVLIVACTVRQEPKEEPRGCGPVVHVACGEPTAPGTRTLAVDATAHVFGGPRTDDRSAEVEVTTDRPDLLRVLDPKVTAETCEGASARVKVLGVGKAFVRFVSRDGSSSAVAVETAAPRKAILVPFLDSVVSSTNPTVLDGDPPKPPAETTEIAQVVGGKMVWEVRYFGANGVPLFGNGASTYTLPPGMTSTLIASAGDRELFELSASQAGEGVLEVRSGSAHLELPARMVLPEAVARLSLFVQDKGGSEPRGPGSGAVRPKNLSQLGVLPRAYDASGAILFGAPYTFKIGGEPVPAGGELLLYDYDPTVDTKPVVVTVAGSRATAESAIRVASPAKLTRSSGRDYADCSFGTGFDGASSFFSSVALVLFVVRRKRRTEAALDRKS